MKISGKDIAAIGPFLEAVALLATMLSLVGLYVYGSNSKSTVWYWFAIFVVLIVVGGFGSVVSSYFRIQESNAAATSRVFRIDNQLLLTLQAVKAPDDVIKGLKSMLEERHAEFFPEQRSGVVFKLFTHTAEITGAITMVSILQDAFGDERTKEIKTIVLKYAERTPPGKGVKGKKPKKGHLNDTHEPGVTVADAQTP
jgi:hypothetical protein